MSETNRIVVDDVSYTYEEAENPTLKHITLSVKPGEFVAVLGHNGSGKSTLAKLMNALFIPTEGKVLVAGMDTADDDRIWDIRRKAGMIFQNPDNQIVATVVREDVAFGLENLCVPHDEMVERIDRALEEVHMTNYAENAPHTLSGGQKQRVAIAGILAMAPDCIIADEATAMLDPSGRKEVLETVHRLNRERGMTVVLITHHMSEVEKADRVIVMEKGEIVMDGTPKEIFPRVEELRELSLDVPGTVDLLYELRRRGWDVPLDALSIEECADAICKSL